MSVHYMQGGYPSRLKIGTLARPLPAFNCSKEVNRDDTDEGTLLLSLKLPNDSNGVASSLAFFRHVLVTHPCLPLTIAEGRNVCLLSANMCIANRVIQIAFSVFSFQFSVFSFQFHFAGGGEVKSNFGIQKKGAKTVWFVSLYQGVH